MSNTIFESNQDSDKEKVLKERKELCIGLKHNIDTVFPKTFLKTISGPVNDFIDSGAFTKEQRIDLQKKSQAYFEDAYFKLINDYIKEHEIDDSDTQNLRILNQLEEGECSFSVPLLTQLANGESTFDFKDRSAFYNELHKDSSVYIYSGDDLVKLVKVGELDGTTANNTYIRINVLLNFTPEAVQIRKKLKANISPIVIYCAKADVEGYCLFINSEIL